MEAGKASNTMKNSQIAPFATKTLRKTFKRDPTLTEVQAVYKGEAGLKYAAFRRSANGWRFRRTRTLAEAYGVPVGYRFVYPNRVSRPTLADPTLERDAARMFLRVDERAYAATGLVYKEAA